MQLTMTKWQLFALLSSQETPWLTLPDGSKGILRAAEREDGSGRNFNLRLLVNGKHVSVFCRTSS